MSRGRRSPFRHCYPVKVSVALLFTRSELFQFRQPPPVTRQVAQNDELSFHITIAPCAFETLKRAALIGLR